MKEEKKKTDASSAPVVLCGASAYEQKYYLNESFQNLPEQIKQELKVMCVLYTEDIGGVFLLEFDENGTLQFCTEAKENDYSYDEIGSVLKIKELRRTKGDLLRSIELYYKVLTGKVRAADIPDSSGT
ncbi:MAG: DUF6145 family protein [Clostridiales bacterium]|nr:DUF6145 family protein [Clostridiales bacterium]